jgi:hypothetical protein
VGKKMVGRGGAKPSAAGGGEMKGVRSASVGKKMVGRGAPSPVPPAVVR